MAGCQRGLSLSKLATHGYNNVITTHINAILYRFRDFLRRIMACAWNLG